MEKIGKATKAIGAAAEGARIPNVGIIRTNAATINDLAAKSENWFPAGTGPDVGKTRAKAEIWQKYDDFAAKDRDFRVAAQALQGIRGQHGRERDQAGLRATSGRRARRVTTRTAPKKEA